MLLDDQRIIYPGKVVLPLRLCFERRDLEKIPNILKFGSSRMTKLGTGKCRSLFRERGSKSRFHLPVESRDALRVEDYRNK